MYFYRTLRFQFGYMDNSNLVFFPQIISYPRFIRYFLPIKGVVESFRERFIFQVMIPHLNWGRTCRKITQQGGDHHTQIWRPWRLVRWIQSRQIFFKVFPKDRLLYCLSNDSLVTRGIVFQSYHVPVAYQILSLLHSKFITRLWSLLLLLGPIQIQPNNSISLRTRLSLRV